MGAVGGATILEMGGLMDFAGEAATIDRIPGRKMRLISARVSTERLMSTRRDGLLPGSHETSAISIPQLQETPRNK